MAGCTDFDPVPSANKLTVEQCDRDAMEGILWVKTIIDDRDAIAQAFARHRQQAEARAEGLVGAKFKQGDRVEKVKGSSWRGRVVGTYSTSLTPEGYAVESENEPGSVQIYPASALTAYRSARP